MNWPRSKGAQFLFASLGAVLLTPILTILLFFLSAEFFDWKYPHDGQNVLGAVAVALFSCPFTLVITFVGLFFLQHWKARVKIDQ